MRNNIHWLIVSLCLLLVSCNNQKQAIVTIDDQTGIISSADSAAIVHLFDSCFNQNIYLSVFKGAQSYQEALDNNPKANIPLRQRGTSLAVAYYVANNYIFVSVPMAYQNTYDSKYAVQMFELQSYALTHKQDKDNIKAAMGLMAQMLQHKQNFFVKLASSITSVVDYFNEALIMPSRSFLHFMFFRIPLLYSLIYVRLTGSIGWSICIAIILLIVIAFLRNMTEGHRLAFSILYVFQFLSLLCLIFFSLPSFDTVMMMRETGLFHSSDILLNLYCNASSTSSSITAAVVFIVLYLIRFAFEMVQHIYNYNSLIEMKQEDLANEYLSKLSDEKGDKLPATIGLFVLVFLLPKLIVWAVCAYLFQQIICSDLLGKIGHLGQDDRKGKFVTSVDEFSKIYAVLLGYFTLPIMWYFAGMFDMHHIIDMAIESKYIYLLVTLFLILFIAISFLAVLLTDYLEDLGYFFVDSKLNMSEKFFKITFKTIGVSLLICILALLALTPVLSLWVYPIFS